MHKNQEQLDKDLLEAVAFRDIKAAQFALSEGASITSQEGKLLKLACFIGDLEITKFLISHGADVNTNELIHFKIAAFNGYLDITQYLIIEHGLDPEIAIKQAEFENQLHIITWCKQYLDIKNLNNHLQQTLENNSNNNTIKYKV